MLRDSHGSRVSAMNVTGHHEITKRAIQELKMTYGFVPLVADFNIELFDDDNVAHGKVSTALITLKALRPDARESGEKNFDTMMFASSGATILLLNEGQFQHTGFNNAPPMSGLTVGMCDYAENPADGSVCTDLAAVVDMGHVSDTVEGQAVHFMRADGQTAEQAHAAAVALIQREVIAAAAAIRNKMSAGQAGWKPGYGLWTSGLGAKHLGRAAHALQDSFAPLHAERRWTSEIPEDPGEITDVFAYGPQDKAAHEAGDVSWIASKWLSKDDFSVRGKKAIAATKELLRVALKLTGDPLLQAGPTWDSFASRCLRFASR